jgi:hypothetical protein
VLGSGACCCNTSTNCKTNMSDQYTLQVDDFTEWPLCFRRLTAYSCAPCQSVGGVLLGGYFDCKHWQRNIPLPSDALDSFGSTPPGVVDDSHEIDDRYGCTAIPTPTVVENSTCGDWYAANNDFYGTQSRATVLLQGTITLERALCWNPFYRVPGNQGYLQVSQSCVYIPPEVIADAMAQPLAPGSGSSTQRLVVNYWTWWMVVSGNDNYADWGSTSSPFRTRLYAGLLSVYRDGNYLALYSQGVHVTDACDASGRRMTINYSLANPTDVGMDPIVASYITENCGSGGGTDPSPLPYPSTLNLVRV